MLRTNLSSALIIGISKTCAENNCEHRIKYCPTYSRNLDFPGRNSNKSFHLTRFSRDSNKNLSY